ncbi:hypothetical protein QTV43_003994 [Vibrio vulnificus]|nr:hypothetical protein [Vibrio vulnificus]
MELDDLDLFLLEEQEQEQEQEQANFPLDALTIKKSKDPLTTQNLLSEYEFDVEDVKTFVYKIQVGDEIAVGRTSRPRSRYLSHANKQKTKAHFIIHKAKDYRDIANVMSILWEGPASESEDMEAYYINKLSTCGQKPEESQMGSHAISSKGIKPRHLDISTRIKTQTI